MIKIRSAVAGCVQPVDALVVTAAVVEVQCGLIPGSSGGGLFVQRGQGLSLVGIISTVSADITANGVVPLASLHELLQHPERYEHDVDGNRPAPAVRQTLS